MFKGRICLNYIEYYYRGCNQFPLKHPCYERKTR